MTIQPRRVRLADAEISFTDDGAGEPVVLVHASACADWFAPVAAELDGFRVVRTHRAGYGDSVDLAGGLGLADHARHVVEVVRSLGIARAHWVGHSFGGAVTLEVARAYPELLSSLVLLETARPFAPDESPHPGVGQAMALAEDGRFDDAYDVFMTAVSGPGYRDTMLRRLGEDGFAAAVANGRYMFGQEFPALGAWRFDADDIAAVRVPALLVEGEHSATFNPAYALRNTYLATHLPDAERLVLTGVSHAMPFEDPAGVARISTEFFRRNPQ